MSTNNFLPSVFLFLFLTSFSYALPPKYTVKGHELTLQAVSPDCPMIYDNDWWTDVPDAAYIWAKASAGKCNLRGNIVSRDMYGQPDKYQYKLADGMKDCKELLQTARASGMRNIPDPVEGSSAALIRPGSGKIEETKFQRSLGSDLIVAEAKNATVKKPLLIFAGGPCTTVAAAYLTDPSIAERMIVFQIDGGGYNGQDGWAWEIVKQRCYFANWARGYFWDKINTWNPEPFSNLPDNPLCNLLKKYAKSELGKANQWGDGAWIFQTFEPRCLSKAEDYDGVAITIPKDGTNLTMISNEFFSTMKDTAVWHSSAKQPTSRVFFPLKISVNHRYLVDSKNKPFFYMADTPWMLLKLSPEEVDDYLNDRKARGFTALQIMITGFMDMKTRDGQTPFDAEHDLSHVNEAYFAYADKVIQKATDKGFLLTIAPLWSGCCGEGWAGMFDGKLKPLNVNGPQKARAYGQFLGARYANYKNIVWLMGGDHNPDQSFHLICNIAEGIHENAPKHFITVHNAPDSSSAAFYDDQPWLTLNGAYSYQELQTPVYKEWSRTKNVRPILLLESGYEHESNDGRGGIPFRIRRQAYEAVLNGALLGTAYGHRDIWKFNNKWRTGLADPGATQVGLSQQFFSSHSWWKLEPDQGDELITDGRGKLQANDYVSAARASDGTLVIAYLPTSRPISINMARLTGSVKSSWLDPTDGSIKPSIGSPFANSGIQSFTTPGRNASGDNDWVLVLETSKR